MVAYVVVLLFVDFFFSHYLSAHVHLFDIGYSFRASQFVRLGNQLRFVPVWLYC